MSFAKDKHAKVLEKLDRTPEDEASGAKRTLVIEDFLMWQTMKDELGVETASRLYREVWSRMGKFGIKAAVQAIGAEEPFSLPTLAKVLKYQYNTYGTCLFEIVESTSERAVADVTSCTFWEYVNETFGKDIPKEEFELYLKDLSQTTFDYCKAVADGMGLKVECPYDTTLCDPNLTKRAPCHLVMTLKK